MKENINICIFSEQKDLQASSQSRVWTVFPLTALSCVSFQSCVYGENRTSIQCTTPSLAKLALQPPVVSKVAFVLDGYSTDQWDLIYVEDPLFQDPKLTSKDNKSIVELKVRPCRVYHPRCSPDV